MNILIKNARVVNEGQIQELDVLIQKGRIEETGKSINKDCDQVVDASGLFAPWDD